MLQFLRQEVRINVFNQLMNEKRYIVFYYEME